MNKLIKINEFHSNGLIKTKGITKNGKRFGKWFTWHLKGQKSKEINYYDGNPVGEWKMWRENGKLHRTGAFDSNGEKAGVWTWYQPDGEIIKRNSL